MLIRAATRDDLSAWKRLRVTLWPDATGPEDEQEMSDYLTRETMTVFVAEAEKHIVGFLEVNIRPTTEDCRTRDVGYIEGWFVDADHRQQGIGAALVAAAEAWARSKGCQEMASDCLLDNDVSLAAHLALGYEERERLIHSLGYEERERLIHFVKPLMPHVGD